MNKGKVFLRVAAALICLVVVLGVIPEFYAKAETTADYPVVSDYDSLVAAIENASYGDTIGIAGTITIQDGGTIGQENKVLTFLRLNENAYLYFGGSGTAIIQNITFEGNEITSPFPFVYADQSITIQNCIFQNCICGGDGGAIAIYSGKAYITNCAFRNNQANNGGHVYVNGASYIEFNSCTFKNGQAVEDGGAVALKSSTSFYFAGCTITGNQAGRYGGGLYNAGNGVFSQCRLYWNVAGELGSDYATEKNGVNMAESVAELASLYESINLIPVEWEAEISESTSIRGGKLIVEYIIPPESEEPDETEPEETPDEGESEGTEPGETETPGEDEAGEAEDTGEIDEAEPSTEDQQPDDSETGDPAEDNAPAENEPDETSPSETETESPDQQTDESDTASPSNTGGVAGDTVTTTTITNSSTSSTDNSDRSTYSTTTTDNSRSTSTSDSNNSSTVNNYYTQQEAQTSTEQGVQTIVIDGGGSGEPIEQIIRIEGSDSGSTEGMTLTVNVNVGSVDQETAASTDQQSSVSWYQVAVLCLLSGILVCLIRKR